MSLDIIYFHLSTSYLFTFINFYFLRDIQRQIIDYTCQWRVFDVLHF